MTDKNHICAICGKALSDFNWWTFGLRNRWDEGKRVKLCDSCAMEAEELQDKMEELEAVRAHMKVYLVFWWNKKPYENYRVTVDGVFSTRKKAVAFIEGLGYSLTKDANGLECWERVVDECNTYSMWIQEEEVDA